jgi:hypothetical protein
MGSAKRDVTLRSYPTLGRDEPSRFAEDYHAEEMSKYATAEAEFRPLGLSTRTINALVGADIYTLHELRMLTERDLSVMPGIGPKAFNQLRIYVRKHGPTIEIHKRPRIVAAQFDPKSLTAIDAWALEQEGITSRPEAIRRLVERGLTVPEPKAKGRK